MKIILQCSVCKTSREVVRRNSTLHETPFWCERCQAQRAPLMSDINTSEQKHEGPEGPFQPDYTSKHGMGCVGVEYPELCDCGLRNTAEQAGAEGSLPTSPEETSGGFQEMTSPQAPELDTPEPEAYSEPPWTLYDVLREAGLDPGGNEIDAEFYVKLQSYVAAEIAKAELEMVRMIHGRHSMGCSKCYEQIDFRALKQEGNKQ